MTSKRINADGKFNFKAQGDCVGGQTQHWLLCLFQHTFNLWVFHENQETISQSGAGGLRPRKEQVSNSHGNAVQVVPRLFTIFYLNMLETDRLKMGLSSGCLSLLATC